MARSSKSTEKLTDFIEGRLHRHDRAVARNRGAVPGSGAVYPEFLPFFELHTLP
jgi:hypothetical protein